MEPIEAMATYLLRVTELCPNWLEHVKGQPTGDEAMMSQDEMNKDLAWEGSDKEDDEGGAGIGFGVTVSTMVAGQG